MDSIDLSVNSWIKPSIIVDFKITVYAVYFCPTLSYRFFCLYRFYSYLNV